MGLMNKLRSVRTSTQERYQAYREKKAEERAVYQEAYKEERMKALQERARKVARERTMHPRSERFAKSVVRGTEKAGKFVFNQAKPKKTKRRSRPRTRYVEVREYRQVQPRRSGRNLVFGFDRQYDLENPPPIKKKNQF